ncbi:hypothetical protein DFH07DRAFT_876062 [Mycena maculata]|uniref:BTB domain-containing protein n=1 Tax=Mycena maculata TaxID=230809 RepID=A0AAD7K6R6_9AGAR|nr:hypothetical protein DFH07DRAFT_876062 [Mycena maculata]
MENDDTRVEDLWFSNDSLVIKAEKSIFQVSRSILAARSSVFADMVAFPQPANGETECSTTVDGSPIVFLHDSASDVSAFLKAIFDSSYFMPAPAPIELDAVLGILRLSHKYNVHYLYLRALEHLSVRFGPLSLDDYRSPVAPDHIIYTQSPALSYFKVISAALEANALWLLPIPYYLATSCSQETLREARAAGADERLVQTCMAEHAYLVRGTAKVNIFLLHRCGPNCASPEACAEHRHQLLNGVFQCFWDDELDHTPLDDWPEDGWGDLSGLCANCVLRARSTHGGVLQELWDELPQRYGLPSWPELNAMRPQ